MKRIKLDGKKMTDRKTAHEYIASKLSFPDYYGKNLDALADCLSEIGEDTQIKLINADVFINNLAPQHKGFIKVFTDIAKSNPHLIFKTDIKLEID
jgi:ribonuclease inhibitor